MQIDYLHLKSFLKHEDKRVDFTSGLNVIRGPNEKGKSSLLEGLGYFLSGPTALEKSLEDTVNDQAKSKASLKVLCGFSHLGRNYTGYRGASGAELSDQDGKVLVTGHKPLTEYLEKLLQLPAGRAHHVVLAKQNEIRGVLAIGPTAATEFIEKLADFSEIDELIKRMITELPNGKTEVLEAQVKSAEETLASITVPEIPDHSAKIANHTHAAQVLAVQAAEHQIALMAGQAEVTAALAARAQLNSQIEAAKPKLSKLQAMVAALREAVANKEALEKRRTDLQQMLEESARYKVFTEVSWIKQAEADLPVWEGDRASLEQEILLQRDASSALVTAARTLQVQIDGLVSRKIGDTVCPTCGHDSGDREAAARHNEKIDFQISNLSEELQEVQGESRQKTNEIQELTSVLDRGTRIENQSQTWAGAFVGVSLSTVPPELIFYGDTPNEPKLSSAELERQLTEVLISLQSAGNKEELSAAETRFEDASKALVSLQSDYAAIAVPDFNSTMLQKEISDLTTAARISQDRAAELQNEVATVKALREGALAGCARWQALLDKTQADLTETRENNVLIKAVKTARLQVSERIWGTIMGGISGYFSRLRGVPSVVVRGPKGFLVDGKAGRPSGSTLDILGLALRIVVAKVFANSGLLVIDEPSANCDRERTANMAAVVAAAGFEQVIWVSHDDIAETCAANLIEM